MKKIIALLLCVSVCTAILALPASASDGVIFTESFDGYATNSIESKFIQKGDPNTRVIADGEDNKALFVPTSASNNTLKTTFSTDAGMYIVSMKLKFTGGKAAFKVSLADGANQEFNLFSVAADGSIALANGKKVGAVLLSRYTEIAIGYNSYVKRYFVNVGGKGKVSDCLFGGSFTSPVALSLKTYIGEENSALCIDDVRVYEGSKLRYDIPDEPYNTKEAAFEPIDMSRQEAAVFVNNDFNVKAKAFNGLAVYNKDNKIEHFPLSDDNGCILMDKTIDESDPFIDIALKNGENALNVVFEAEVSSDKLGSTLYLFNVKGEDGRTVQTFHIKPTGTVTLYNGTAIGQISKGEFLPLAAVYDFMKGTFDVYVNKELVKSGVAIGGKGFTAATSARIQQMPSQGNGQIMLDNIKVYEGKEPYTLVGETIDDYTVLPGNDEDAEKLRGTVALNSRGEYLFARTQRIHMGKSSYMQNDCLMVPSMVFDTGLGQTVSHDEATGSIKVGDNITMTVGSTKALVSGREFDLGGAPAVTDSGLYLPLKAIVEEGLGMSFMHNQYGLVVVSDMPFKYADDDAKCRVLSTYLLFPRIDREGVIELFEKSGYKNVHPRLLANKDDFDRIRREYSEGGRIREWSDNVIKEADACLDTEPQYHYLQNNQMLECAHIICDRLYALSYAYQITGKDKYAERAWKEMENACVNFPNWNYQHFLDVGEMSFSMAIGYDWCYDYLNEDQRRTIRNALLYFGLEEGRNQYQGKPTGTNFVFQDMNWNAVCNGGLVAAACAIMEDEPIAAGYTVANALRSFEYMIPVFAPDGAWVEGPSYWQYAVKFMTYMVDSVKYTLGTDFNILNYPGLDRTADFIFAMEGNKGTNNFHDAGGAVSYMCSSIMWLANYFERGGMLKSYLDRLDKMGESGGVFECIYYNEDLIGNQMEAMPLDNVSKVLELGSMRSSWTDLNGMWVSFHGGKNMVNHYHVDEGTFLVDMLGERWATEIGGDGLSYTGNFGGGRTDLYALRPEAHNTYVINPSEAPGQEMSANCPIIRTESKPRGGYQIMDLTTAYVNDVHSAYRGMMLTDDRRTAIIRDEIDLIKESEIYWFSHTEADIEVVDNETAILTKNGKRMQVKFKCEGGTYELKEMEEKPLPTSPVIQGQADKSAYSKLAVILKGSGKVSITARFTPADEYSAERPIDCGDIDTWSIPDGEVTPVPMPKGVYADGKLVYGFDENLSSYTVKLSPDAQKVPVITVDSGNYAKECISEAKNFGEKTVYKLTDANGKYQKVTVTIEKLKALDPVDGRVRHLPILIAASYNPESHNPDQHAGDGDLATRWSANGSQTLTYDFGDPVSMEGFAVAVMNSASRSYVFSVEVSDDGKNYTSVYSGNTEKGKDGYQIFEVAPVTARYVRFVGNGNNENSWNSITEFAVLGSKQ